MNKILRTTATAMLCGLVLSSAREAKEYDNDVIYATSIGTSIGRSEDRGFSWVFAGNGIDDLPIVIMPFLMDPENPDLTVEGYPAPVRAALLAKQPA